METKICTKCNKELPKTSEYFASRYDRKIPQFQTFCRDCQKLYRREHYNKYKEYYKLRSFEYKHEVIDWFVDLKKTLSCTVCGESRYWTLDFHHLTPIDKEYTIASMVSSGSKRKILEEIKKCIILCANCHRDLHYKEKTQV